MGFSAPPKGSSPNQQQGSTFPQGGGQQQGMPNFGGGSASGWAAHNGMPPQGGESFGQPQMQHQNGLTPQQAMSFFGGGGSQLPLMAQLLQRRGMS